ncbi:helicase-related protein [Burkholderia pseudomallei]|uniref:helicase-related protein n=1 Tax=Burkholderia pseudomallei TaxID=28450 RepID=UPI0007BF6F45|nr:SNF2-related protein [Burkholderia pseudomallei]NAX51833.1 DEAD/DEAH box helicase family protein [Burkholderia pseudomallei]NAX71755.1 DEAD/DEAH box helicase family protein [Burkholderia pseudomallei]NAY57755.1 DEAD/DEAH box helicase family protein [Burkholderia pseudomallei]NAY64076.1 DEAD/DEAH box helicase family protein [Burkholderia pseudomallei]NAY70841.1 DEAD/DEAH box helicase family protein [Burkholderia pseudomallei]
MELIDNINRLFGDDLKQALVSGARLKVAASCFSMYAYEALKAELEKIEELNFIFTAPTFVADEVTDKIRRERREFHIPKLDRERSLYGSEFEIQLRNQLTQRAIAKECADWLQRKAKFRSNRSKAPMQQFALVQSADASAAYLPLHGFTAVDLGYQQGNAVSNLVNKIDEPGFTTTYLSLFDQIWNDPEKLEDVTAQICDHIASVYQENSPESIYFLMLYNIFNEFLDDISEDVLPNDRTGYQDTLIWNKLFNYQKDAATGLINKLETYSGCILADSVGLGKTFTALAVIKYYELRNRSVLVLCPKKLADNWLNYNRNLKTNIFARDRFSYDVLCHTDLSRTSGESFGTPLNRINWGNYDLVVIDESHNFRNNDAYKDKETRYQKLMNKVIREGVKTKVLMLSATPVNNRFADLRNQLALAYEGDSENLSKKLRTSKSVEEVFRNAQKAFNAWSKLPPEERTPRAILDALDFDFFELLDSVTIARSRRHIQTFYDTKDIGQFPERRKPQSFHCALTTRSDVMSFNEIFEQLTKLMLAVYAPAKYILASKRQQYIDRYNEQSGDEKGNLSLEGRESGLQRLMTVNLLKRLESSVQSFRLTLQSLQANHRNALEKIAAHKQTGSAASVADLTEVLEDIDTEEDDLLDELDQDSDIGGKVKINLADMDLPSWEHDLKVDLANIEALLASMAKITPADDAKLQHVKALVLGKIANPINPGNRKVLIFTAFADTADYLYANLAPELLVGQKLHTGKVTGSDRPKSTLPKAYDFQELLTLFSPRSKEKAIVLPNEPAEIDVLIGTDCISEGQNLQDCDYLINYDIHWNPVRIIQRFGRVDRIGSPNRSIQLVNYWPDISLDEYINLKERVENRMMIVDVTATGDDNVISAQANDMSYRKEQLRRLQEEVIELEDLKTGVSITDLGLNDFRMDLLNYVKTHGELDKSPNGLHAIVPANSDLGLAPGVIFTLRNRNSGVNPPANLPQHNRLHPYYLVYINNDGEVVHDHTEVKRLLDLARTCCKGQAEPIADACQRFNKATADGRRMQPYSDLLSKAIHSMIAVKEEKDLDSLFTGGKTTALTHTITGLDDFELIAFLVIQGAE